MVRHTGLGGGEDTMLLGAWHFTEGRVSGWSCDRGHLHPVPCAPG